MNDFFSFLLKNYSEVYLFNQRCYIAFDDHGKEFFLKVVDEKPYSALRSLSYPSIVVCRKIYPFDGFYLLEFPYISGENLTYDFPFTKDALADFVRAVFFLIEHNVVHSDLRPSNLLVRDGNIFIVDFNSSCGSNQRRKVGVSFYSPPELNEGFTHEYTDLYSLGLIFSYLLLKEELLTVDYSDNLKFRSGLLELLQRNFAADPLISLIHTFLRLEPSDRRISLQKALESIYTSKLLGS